MTDILSSFASMLSEDNLDDESNDIEATFDCWAESTGELSEDDILLLKMILNETTAEAYGQASDANIRKVLKILGQGGVNDDVTMTTPNKNGMTPLKNEKGARAFLRQLKTATRPYDPHNNTGFRASSYKAFPREKNHFGYDYSYANDFNNQPDSPPGNRALANPTLNVRTEAFAAVDAIGMNMAHQYKVVNLLTSEFVTGLCHKEDAQKIANELNAAFAVELAQLDETKRAANEIPSLALQENIFRPLNPAYLKAFQKENYTMSGSIAQSGAPSTAVSDWKAAQLLIERRKGKFGENENHRDEFDSIRAVQQRAVKR